MSRLVMARTLVKLDDQAGARDQLMLMDKAMNGMPASMLLLHQSSELLKDLNKRAP